MHCGAIGSQRVWVAVSTPSCATGTGRTDHRGPCNHPHPLATNATEVYLVSRLESRFDLASYATSGTNKHDPKKVGNGKKSAWRHPSIAYWF